MSENSHPGAQGVEAAEATVAAEAAEVIRRLGQALSASLVASESLTLSAPVTEADASASGPRFAFTAKYVDIVFPSRYVDLSLPLSLSLRSEPGRPSWWGLQLRNQTLRVGDRGQGTLDASVVQSVLSVLRGTA